MNSNLPIEKRTLICVPLTNLKLSEKASLSLFLLHLSNFKDKKDIDIFQEQYGLAYTSYFLKEPYFRYLGNIDDLKIRFFADENRLLTININNILTVFLNIIWLVKDNSINLRMLVLKNNGFTHDRKLISFTTASGQFIETELNQEEIIRVLEFFKKIHPLIFYQKIDTSSIPLNGKGFVSTESFSVLYNPLSRFERAFNYLMIARSQTKAISKIASMVSACECLFTIRKKPINAQLKRMIPEYIGENVNDKNKIEKLINNAYNIRSKYLHGDKLPNNYNSREKLNPLVIYLDSILRKIFVKIIEGDSEYFTNPESFKKLMTKLESKRTK